MLNKQENARLTLIDAVMCPYFSKKFSFDMKIELRQILLLFYLLPSSDLNKISTLGYYLLYISTSFWVLRNPNADQNIHFQHFCAKMLTKCKKVANLE